MCSRSILLVMIRVAWRAHAVAAWAWLPRWTSLAEGSAVTAFFPARLAQELERFLFHFLFFCPCTRLYRCHVLVLPFHRC